MRKTKKAYAQLDIRCVHCGAEMDVKVFRRRLSEPAPPADDDYAQEIQLKLPGAPLAKNQEEAATV